MKPITGLRPGFIQFSAQIRSKARRVIHIRSWLYGGSISASRMGLRDVLERLGLEDARMTPESPSRRSEGAREMAAEGSITKVGGNWNARCVRTSDDVWP